MDSWIFKGLISFTLSIILFEQGDAEQRPVIILRCEFERDKCGFAPPQHGHAFERLTRGTSYAANVPRRGENETREYFLFRQLFNPMSHASVLVSEETSAFLLTGALTSNRHCLRFWLHMRTNRDHVFTAYTTDEADLEKEVFKQIGDSELSWSYTSVNLMGPFTAIGLKLLVIPESNIQRMQFALDDLTLEEGSCFPEVPTPESISCTFEDSHCGYVNTNDESDNGEDLHEWNVTSYAAERSLRPDQVPRTDYTYHTADGHYLTWIYIDRTDSFTSRQVAAVKSPFQNVTGPQCVTFAYQNVNYFNMVPITFTVTALLNDKYDEGVPLWHSLTSHGYKWTVVKANITEVAIPSDTTVPVSLHFHGSTTLNSFGTIAVDDVTIRPGQCSVSGDCSFDSQVTGYCDWQAVEGEEASMAWSKGLPDDGPESSSEYIYFRGGRGSGHVVGSRAAIYSDGLSSAECMTFNYYMDTPGAAEIRIHQVQLITTKYVIWRTDGQSDTDDSRLASGWRSARVPIRLFDDADFYSIVLEARVIRETTRQYVVAVDDVIFLEDSCERIPVSAAPDPDLLDAPIEFSRRLCTFEGGQMADTQCGYENDTSATLPWSIATTSSAGSTTDDHTLSDGSGSYLLFQSTATAKPGDVARAVSLIHAPSVATSQPTTATFCVRLWYQFVGSQNGSATFRVIKSTADGRNTTLFQLDQYFQTAWTLVTANSDDGGDAARSSAFRLVLEVEIQHENAVVMAAVDDIAVTEGTCEDLDCDFEEGMCGWTNEMVPLPNTSADLMWEYRHALDGHDFALRVPILPTTPAGQTALLKHAEFLALSGPSLCLQFEYIFQSPEAGSLSVLYQKLDSVSRAPLWTSRGRATNGTWQTGYVFIRSFDQFTVLFKVVANEQNGTLSETESHSIGLDNIVNARNRTESTCKALTDGEQGTSTPSPTIPPALAPLSQYSCNFDQRTFCGWTAKAGQTFKSWKLANQTVEELSGPDRDVSGNGYFAYLDTSDFGGRVARLRSPSIVRPTEGTDSSPEYFVLGFWYMMFGDGVERLEVRFINGDSAGATSKALWSTQDNQGKIWRHVHLVVPFKENVRLVFDGSHRFAASNRGGLISLDELTIESGGAPDQFDEHVCDFDTPTQCGYKQEPEDNPAWVWRNGITTMDLNDTGPLVDKSQNTVLGYYMAFDGKGSTVGSQAVLRSTVQPPSAEACVKFYYYQRSNAYPGTLSVVLMKGNVRSEIEWTDVNIIGGDFWEPVFFTIESPTDPWRVLFVAQEIVPHQQSIFAIDHISLTNGSCPAGLLACDFDDGTMCEWYNAPNPFGEWLLTSGPSTSPTTGPSADQAGSVTGGYLMFESDGTVLERLKRRLISTPLTTRGTGAVCLTFWYHMFGDDVGLLTIYQIDVQTMKEKGIWMLSGNQQNQWRQGSVPLSWGTPFQVVFEAEKIQDGLDGNIAIDAIEELVSGSPCHVQPPAAVVGSPSVTTPSPMPGAVLFDCDFEDGTTCAFQNPTEHTNGCAWVVHRGVSASAGAPTSDHTTQSSNGSYLHFNGRNCEGTWSSTDKVGVFTKMPIIDFVEPTKCLTFWYYMDSPALLAVITHYTNGTNRMEVQRRSDPSPRWRKTAVTIENTEKTPYNLAFEASPAATHFGDLSLDDISLHDGACPPTPQLCDFELEDLCHFTPIPSLQNARYEWKRVKPTIPNHPPAAALDHTLESAQGHFMYASGLSFPSGAQTYLFSPQQALLDYTDQCVTFWYYLGVLPSSGELKVHIQSPAISIEFGQTVWAVSLPAFHTRGSWEYGTASVSIGHDFIVIFEAVNRKDSYIAIDDVLIVQDRCPRQLTCDFEDGMCGWSNVKEYVEGVSVFGDLDWILHEGAVISGSTPGPTVDHTLNSIQGHYIYIGNEFPNDTTNDAAELTSPRILAAGSGPTDWCFTFWYHMHMDSGTADGTLKLEKLQFNETLEELAVVSTLQRNIWTKLSVDIPSVSGDFRLRFTGTMKGSNILNAIALDDFWGNPSACPEDIPVFVNCTGEVKQISLSEVCDQVAQCADGSDEAHCGSCSFEPPDSLCGYTVFNNDYLNWSPTQLGTATSSGLTGPGAVGNSTTYMGADLSKGDKMASVYLDSPWLHETASTCQVAFWYNFFSNATEHADAGHLFVYLQLEDTETTLAIIERDPVTSSGGWSEWQTSRVDIGRKSGEFRLAFRARKGMVDVGFIALDNIVMESCGFLPAIDGPCDGIYGSHWKCPISQGCIPSYQRCDFSDDCGKNGEDEIGCEALDGLRCSFESGFCSWRNDASNGVNWTHTTRGTPTPYSGPLRDHTTGLKGGGFIYMKSSSNAEDIGKKGRLVSPVIAATAAGISCQLRFFYHLYGRSALAPIQISVQSEGSSDSRKCAEIQGLNQGDIWHTKIVPLSNDLPFRVVIESSIGGNSSDVAIDDVSFDPECVVHDPVVVSTAIPPTVSEGLASTATGSSTPTKSGVSMGPTSTSGHRQEAGQPHPFHSDQQLGAGPIAGIVVGVLVGVLLAFTGLFLVVRHRRRIGEAQAGLGWLTASYDNFGALNGATVDESDDHDTGRTRDSTIFLKDL